jgi:hypothetical protein
MQIKDTSRGRIYAVSSEIGCTAINGAMAVDIPAGGQSVILALDKKLIIDGDDNAKFVEVRWGTNAAVGSRPAPSWIGDVVDGLGSVVGEGKFDVNYIPAENKLYLQFSLEVTAEQIEEVKSLLERVLPSNVVTELEWADGLPIDYTPLEYIQHQPISSTIDNYGSQYIVSDIAVDDNTATEVVYTPFVLFQGRTCHLLGAAPLSNTDINGGASWSNLPSYVHSLTLSNQDSWLNWGRSSDTLYANTGKKGVTIGQKSKVLFEKGKVTIDGTSFLYEAGNITPNTRRIAIGASRPRYSSETQLHEVSIWKNGGLVAHFIPALDPTGAPCMFDTVSSDTYYNCGTRDFLYPGKEEEATTYSLRRRDYAQLTERGVRRLYRVPAGYNGGKEEYAAEHGFKELVEPPAPYEGYWVPQWRETETQLILEWVETEEELQIEEIENA